MQAIQFTRLIGAKPIEARPQAQATGHSATVTKPKFDFAKAIAKLEASKANSAEPLTNEVIDSTIASANAGPKAIEQAELVMASSAQSPQSALRSLEKIAEHRYSEPADANEVSTSPVPEAIVKAVPTAIPMPSASQASTFTWDDSQLAAIDSILDSRFSCLIGAAGSGKTTVVKEIVNRLIANGTIRPLDYVRCNGEKRSAYNVSFVSFTGKAVEQLRKSIPPELQCCCETIHSLLEYAPVIVDKLVTDKDGRTSVKQSKIFEPRRNASLKVNQSVIIIDESGMVGIDLWNNLYKALDLSNPSLKIILIGDINQLPAVIGKSILGYALNSPRWTTATLKHIHRQAMDNPIIANAHAIKDGRSPNNSPSLGQDADGKPQLRQFTLMNIGELTEVECNKVRSGELTKSYYDLKNKETNGLKLFVNFISKLYHGGYYNPDLDQVIVPQNVGMLGQEMVNSRLAPLFNSTNRRHAIRASYETKFLAIGDKVMFTKNEYEVGILNGMVGRIKNISLNTNYQDYALMKVAEEQGSATQAFTVTAESANFAEQAFADLNKFAEQHQDDKSATAELEASHIVVVEYTPLGSSQPSEIALSKVGQIRGLLLAYAITCHKAQGSEYRRVVVLTHSANSQMLSREWLYTAVTRARENCLLVYNNYCGKGLATALRRQVVKGESIEEKAKNFSLAEATKASTESQLGLIPLGIFNEEQIREVVEDYDEEYELMKGCDDE